jgi:hypothetical protein
LTGADVNGAQLSGADLRQTRGLTQEMLDDADTDAKTQVSPPLIAHGTKAPKRKPPP